MGGRMSVREAARALLEKDAERYRFLRDHACYGGYDLRRQQLWTVYRIFWGENLDAAIDSCMQEPRK